MPTHPAPSAAQGAKLPGVREDPGHQPRAEQQGQPEGPAGEHRHPHREPGEGAEQEQAQRGLLTPPHTHTHTQTGEVRGRLFLQRPEVLQD